MGNEFRVGVVSFTDPRETLLAEERERYIERKHKELVSFLQSYGFKVIDPISELRADWKEVYGVRTGQEVQRCVHKLQEEGAECLVLGCWHWTEPQLPLSLVRKLNLPVLLYAEDDPTWAGSVCLGAVGASLWEAGVNEHALRHNRLRGDKEEVVRWAKGVCGLQKLRDSTLLLWGGSYCLRMEHLQDDVPVLKAFLIGDVISEGEYILIKRAEKILKENSKRVDDFIFWLTQNKAQVVYDERMLTPEVFRRQAALYLAARDRLKELEGENIAGVSVKCQPELSVEYGVTGCLLPGFLPFSEDSEGKQKSLPTVCEGDIKGLITCTWLSKIYPDVPPLFGDLKYISQDYIIISNCGGSSIYYAGNSNKASEVLPRVTISGQCQGEAGGAVGYDGKPGIMTIARLTRIRGEYYMQLGVGEALEITEEIKKNILWGQMWPHIAINLKVNPGLLTRIVGSNHLSGIPGDCSKELYYGCREAGIPIIRIDSEEDISAALESYF